MNDSPHNLVSSHGLLEQLGELLLPGVRPYFVPASALPAELVLDDALAFTGRLLDVALRPELQRLGMWRGRSPAIVLNDSMIQEVSDHQAGLERDLVIAAGVHELCHVAADLGVDREPRQIGPAGAAALFAYARLEALGGDESWPHHSPKWFRSAAHAIYRAESIGLTVSPMLVFQSERYHPTMTGALLACASELKPLAAVPLGELNRITTPAEFADLWRFKAAAWRRSRPRIDAAADHALESLEQELQPPIAG